MGCSSFQIEINLEATLTLRLSRSSSTQDHHFNKFCRPHILKYYIPSPVFIRLLVIEKTFQGFLPCICA